MLSLVIGLIAMFVVAIGILAIARLPVKIFLFITSLFILSTSSLYFIFCNPTVTKQWFTQGQQHYQLLVEFEKLGGVEGAIKKIKQKLQENPRDARGWYILAKLYLTQGKEADAKEALAQADKFNQQS